MTQSPDATPRPAAVVEIGALTRADIPAAAALYWEAFKDKLGFCLAPEHRALAFLARVISPDFAIGARDDAGRLIGVAGFKTETGAFVGGGFGDLAAVYGWPGGAWRAVALSLIERGVEPGRLLMDGICVAEAARGLGVGTTLLDAVAEEARRRGASEIRLDVIDRNPRARALYERRGFQAVGDVDLGPLRRLFGFRRATTMLRATSP